ncbi:MAG TPA: LacI family DNA-binding transcriptional regulator [Alphaproteobacteria bacterium]|nr:LacI family DNA-binding transcriptional regulator [Alphaproteobacteria bacterium]
MAGGTKGTVQSFERRATMSDVAKRAGVSQATVSLVLNGVGGVRISAATRSKVLGAAEELGYRAGRRAIAPGLARSIGMLVDEVATTPFSTALFEGANEVASQAGCVLQLVITRSQPWLEEAALDMLLSQPCAGILYTSVATRLVAPPDRLRAVPTVLLNCHAPENLHPAVVPGDVEGARSATEALLRAGHRRIAFINGESWMEAARERAQGYRQALSAAGVPFDPRLVRIGKWHLREAYDHTLALMALDDPPTAIFCASDRMATGCYEALKELGKAIPDDVSVVGYDDDWMASLLRPSLTTVLLPHEAMGRWAAECLLALADGPRPRQRPTRLQCPLIERSSVGPCPR